jgi:hypothetical protein
MKAALKDQFHAALAMLADCIEKCPDHLWNSARGYRSFWRISLHAIYFTHLYITQGVETFSPWPGDTRGLSPDLIEDPDDPLPILPDDQVYTKQELMDYLRFVDAYIDPTIDALDLETDQSGFPWYPTTPKLNHVLLNLRHLSVHTGQLSELLMAEGIDTKWISRRPVSR